MNFCLSEAYSLARNYAANAVAVVGDAAVSIHGAAAAAGTGVTAAVAKVASSWKTRNLIQETEISFNARMLYFDSLRLRDLNENNFFVIFNKLETLRESIDRVYARTLGHSFKYHSELEAMNKCVSLIQAKKQEEMQEEINDKAAESSCTRFFMTNEFKLTLRKGIIFYMGNGEAALANLNVASPNFDLSVMCLGIMEKELHPDVRKVLSEMGLEEAASDGTLSLRKIKNGILKLKKIYAGPILDLPIRVCENKTLKMLFCSPDDLKIIIWDINFSQHERDSLIFSSSVEIEKDIEAGNLLSEGFSCDSPYKRAKLVDKLLEKGANFSESHWFSEELEECLESCLDCFGKKSFNKDTYFSIEKLEAMILNGFDPMGKRGGKTLSELLNKKLSEWLSLNDYDLTEWLTLHGYDLKGEKGGKTLSELLNKILSELLRRNVQLASQWIAPYELALDYGDDPRKIISQEKIDKIEQSLAGEYKQEGDRDLSPVERVDGYILPLGIEKWEFQLIKRWKVDRIYQRALANVERTVSVRVDAGAAADPHRGVAAAAGAAGKADATGKKSAQSAKKINPLMEAMDRAVGGIMPNEILALIGGVNGYSPPEREVVLEVHRLRAEKLREESMARSRAERAEGRAAAAGAAAGAVVAAGGGAAAAGAAAAGDAIEPGERVSEYLRRRLLRVLS